MIYMTAEHRPPERHILQDDHLHAVAPLIRRGDIHRLAQLGVLRHVTADGPAPLGYTPWILAEDAYGPYYYRETDGTPEARQAAIEAHEAAMHEAYLDGLECTRLQGKIALIQAGLWAQYEALIATMLPTMTDAQRVFVEDAPVWKYRDPVLQAFVAALGLTEDQAVALFLAAATL